MATLALTLYRYAVAGGRIASSGKAQVIEVEDGAGSGLAGPQDLAAALAPDGAGELRGPQGDDPGREPVLALCGEGWPDAFTLYTPRRLDPGEPASPAGLIRDFAPLCAEPADVVCFAADTLIDTARGPVAAGDLAIGDWVRTRDEGMQPIRWIGRQRVDAGRLALHPQLRPIRIRAGALGDGTPSNDLILSPQHRVLVRSRIAQRMFGHAEVLVAAKQLCQLDGIDIALDLDTVSYVHFMFDRHQIVFSNGAQTESLLAGPEALKSVGAAARAEILALFPELAGQPVAAARPLASGRMGRKLAIRHLQNARPLMGSKAACKAAAPPPASLQPAAPSCRKT
ncbi:Hint domain-containing protein [Paracoccus contaminans]|uniref:Hint domain-containing protein n=1 Tax=Paracoccus contaminans TaxID=1945662 RepID=UPI001F0A5215|nr:Hint domain-containing protein [Paracoccus contaminans]